MDIETEEFNGFYGFGLWLKPHLKMFVLGIWKWQIRFYYGKRE